MHQMDKEMWIDGKKCDAEVWYRQKWLKSNDRTTIKYFHNYKVFQGEHYLRGISLYAPLSFKTFVIPKILLIIVIVIEIYLAFKKYFLNKNYSIK